VGFWDQLQGAGWSPRPTQFSLSQPTEQFNGLGWGGGGGGQGSQEVPKVVGHGRRAPLGLPPAHLCPDGFWGCSVNRLHPTHSAILL
jgi:hypothetical protein